MEYNQGNRENEGQDNMAFVADPLAELAAELALCILAIEEYRGAFCDYCTCQLGFHILTDSKECELCGCTDIYIRPQKPVLSSIPTTKQVNCDPDSFWRLKDANTRTDGYSRSREAREALKELTE